MVQLRRDPDLAKEPLAGDRLRPLRLEHLDGDRAIVLQVGGEIHPRECALTDPPLDPVAGSERSAYVGEIGILIQAAIPENSDLRTRPWHHPR